MKKGDRTVLHYEQLSQMTKSVLGIYPFFLSYEFVWSLPDRRTHFICVNKIGWLYTYTTITSYLIGWDGDSLNIQHYFNLIVYTITDYPPDEHQPLTIVFHFHTVRNNVSPFYQFKSGDILFYIKYLNCLDLFSSFLF